MSRIFTLVFLLSTVWGVSSAQHDHRLCGYDLLVQEMAEKHESFSDAFRQSFSDAQELGFAQTEAERNTLLTIPVVVHVVWNTNRPAENLDDAVILDQIAVLNEDYRKLNSDAVNIRPEFAGITGDAMIQFDLVEIVRVETTANYNNFDIANIDRIKRTAQGGSDAWDTENYLNIWIGKLPGLLGGQLLGYAYPPLGLPNWPAGQGAPSPDVDGVVVDFRTVGRNNPNTLGGSYQSFGRTATHEVGHYLGLRHIWADPIPIFQNGCQVDDGVDDTPVAKAQSSSYAQVCGPGVNRQTCGSLDMWENYMDYATESCQIAFTEGQISLMRGVLEGPRAELVSVVNAVNLTEVKDFNVYPNPVFNGTTRFFASESPNSIEIYDIVGKRVYFSDAVSSGQEIDVSGMQKGIYLIVADFDSGQATQKIFVK